MPRRLTLCHTSDWHLGHSLHGHSRGYEHERFLSFLLDVLVREEVDGLVIAGDVFDGANPPAAAQAQLFGFLAEARARVDTLIAERTEHERRTAEARGEHEAESAAGERVRAEIAETGVERERMEGELTYIAPFLDPKTRTAEVRLELDNASGRLKPEMFGNAVISGTPRPDGAPAGPPG